MKLDALALQFERFVGKMRDLNLVDEESRRAAAKDLETDYLALYGAFVSMSPTSLRECLGNNEAKIATANQLFLGKDPTLNFQRRFKHLIGKDPGRTTQALSEFISTHEAYLLNRTAPGTKVSQEGERAGPLVATTLGMEGALVAEQFVRKVMTELTSQVIGYAHSHLCRNHIQEWEANKTLQKTYGEEVGNYLVDCIAQSQSELIYQTRDVEGEFGEILPVGVAIKEPVQFSSLLDRADKPNQTKQTAVRLSTDTCYVNHDDKIIVVGGATPSEPFDGELLRALSRYVIALEQLTQTDPRYAGYKIKPFLYHVGCFSSDPNESTVGGLGLETVGHLRAAGIPQEMIHALALSPLVNLMAEGSPSPELGKVFRLINPHIAGTRTLPQYQTAERAAAAPNTREGTIEALGMMEAIIDALNHPGIEWTKARFHGEKIEAILGGVVSAVANFPLLFAADPSEISLVERKCLVRLSSKLLQLYARPGLATNFPQIAQSMRRVAADAASLEKCDALFRNALAITHARIKLHEGIIKSIEDNMSA